MSSKLMSLLRKEKKEKTANDEINIKDIRGNFLYTKDNQIMCYIKIHALNLFLLSDKEKNSIKRNLAAELSSETKPMKFFEIARPIEVTNTLDELRNLLKDTKNQIQKSLIKKHINDLVKLAFMGDCVERQNFLILSQNYNDYAEKDLRKRAEDMITKFANCKVTAELLQEEQIIQLCSSFTNMSVAYREDSEYEDEMPMVKWEE